MLEDIFRNIWDIRIFDAMIFFTTPEEAQDTYDIMELLGCPEYEYIQINDSIEHLVKEHILNIIHDSKYYSSNNELNKHLVSAVMVNSFNTAKEIK